MHPEPGSGRSEKVSSASFEPVSSVRDAVLHRRAGSVKSRDGGMRVAAMPRDPAELMRASPALGVRR